MPKQHDEVPTESRSFGASEMQVFFGEGEVSNTLGKLFVRIRKVSTTMRLSQRHLLRHFETEFVNPQRFDF